MKADDLRIAGDELLARVLRISHLTPLERRVELQLEWGPQYGERGSILAEYHFSAGVLS